MPNLLAYGNYPNACWNPGVVTLDGLNQGLIVLYCEPRYCFASQVASRFGDFESGFPALLVA